MFRTGAVIVAIGASVCCTASQAQTSDIDGFVGRTFNAGKTSVPYRLFAPKDYDRTKRYPLIVWFHGAGGTGTDNVKQLSGDQVAGTRLWISPENQANHPAFVLAPQSAGAWQVRAGASDLQPEPRIVLEILDVLAAEYPIDARRVYLVAQSLGASGAWNLVANRPERFAAVLLVCPVGFRSLARSSAAARVPFWIFEGALDIRPDRPDTQTVIDALRHGGGHPVVTVYPDAGHRIWDRAFAEPEIAQWLFAQSR